MANYDKKFFVDINLNGNEIKNVVLDKRSSSPTEEIEGKMYYHDGLKTIFFYDGTQWVDIGSSSTIQIDNDRLITRDFNTIQGVNIHTEVGGAQLVNIEDFIESVFYPDIKAEITLSILGGTSLVELGDNTDRTLSATIIVHDWNNQAPAIHEYSDFLIAGLLQAGPYTYLTANYNSQPAYTFDAEFGSESVDSTVNVLVNTNTHVIRSNSIVFNVVMPHFYGENILDTIEDGTIYTDLIKGTLGVAFTSRVFHYNITEGRYIYFCIPTAWGKKVGSIIDNAGSGDDVISAFVTEQDAGVVLSDLIRNVTRASKWDEDYYVYVTKTPLSVGEQDLQFNLITA
jgi:hypothetical protein